MCINCYITQPGFEPILNCFITFYGYKKTLYKTSKYTKIQKNMFHELTTIVAMDLFTHVHTQQK